jgi:hypothetical protein
MAIAVASITYTMKIWLQHARKLVGQIETVGDWRDTAARLKHARKLCRHIEPASDWRPRNNKENSTIIIQSTAKITGSPHILILAPQPPHDITNSQATQTN